MLLQFIFFFFINSSFCLNENELRVNLFKNYNKQNRPVLNNSDNVLLKYGLEVNNLIYFDQKSENIEITMKNILSWEDEFLKWNKKDSSPLFITVGLDRIWQPDLELYNAASKPKVFDKNPRVKIFSNGTVEYIRYITYSFACKLNLERFPFDRQKCDMLFGSWKYPKNILDIKPFINDKFSNFSINRYFSHNEWKIDRLDLTHKDVEYKCCPGLKWPNSVYSITFKRNPHKYNIMIIMAIFITLSALSINIISINIYNRTYILVFIPLTLIWLQIHTSSKIPVINESTQLERIIMTCFFTTIISTFESGILYCFLTNFNSRFSKMLKMNEYKNINKGYQFRFLTVTKSYNESIKNLDYTNLLSNVKNLDIVFRVSIFVIFMITIISLFSF